MSDGVAVLGIDAGGSSAGWLLADEEGGALASGRTPGITGHILAMDGPAYTSEGELYIGRLRQILSDAGRTRAPSAVAMGAAGLETGSRAARHLTQLISSELGLAESAVLVCNDMEIAYRTVFEPGAGVLVYGGTGSIAYHLPRSGPALRVGGHGYLIDDAGGGYWIGRQALSWTLRWHDELGVPASKLLAKEVYALLGSRDWPDIREEIYGQGRSRVAALAPAVARAAARGDEAAADILAGAGVELARLANIALRRLGQILPVALAGGVAKLGRPLLQALECELPSGTQFTLNGDDPVTGAARLALQLVPGFRST